MADQTIYPPGIDARSRQTGLIAYALFGVAIVAWPAIIAGIIFTYFKRAEGRGSILESHFEWLIRTFWIAAIVGGIAFILSFILIGIPILFVVGIWYIYRVVKGAIYFWDGKDLEDPYGFF